MLMEWTIKGTIQKTTLIMITLRLKMINVIRMMIVMKKLHLWRELTRAAIVTKTATTKMIPVKRIQVTLRWRRRRELCKYIIINE